MEDKGFFRRYGWTTFLNLLSVAIILTAIPTTLFLTLNKQQTSSVKAGSLPDIAVLYVEKVPNQPLIGQKIIYQVHIKNIGDASTGPFDYQFTINGLTKERQLVQNLNPKEEIIIEERDVWAANTVLKIQADTSNIVKEKSKNNNLINTLIR